MARKRPQGAVGIPTQGNFVAEWFGHRVFPVVASNPGALADQSSGRCPFLSHATAQERPCIKSTNSRGICTISTTTAGARQDWLVCPYRAVQQTLLDEVVRRIYPDAPVRNVLVVPAPSLAGAKVRRRLAQTVKDDGFACVFFEAKLGGELSIPPTERSPEMSFDFTLVPVVRGQGGRLAIGRHGILEIQTMDFHGTYRAAARNLTDALRLYGTEFHAQLASKSEWLSDGIEGPNIANVFKRTFYQMMLKFQIAADEASAGCVLALPAAVWDSWQRHLARPQLEAQADGTYRLFEPTRSSKATKVSSWIVVFDIDATVRRSPSPLVVRQIIGTTAEALAYYALREAPKHAVAGAGNADAFVRSVRRRLRLWWPELAEAPLAERPSS